MEEAAWHVAVSLPAFPDYVCEDLKASTLCRVSCAFRVTGVLGLGFRALVSELTVLNFAKVP